MHLATCRTGKVFILYDADSVCDAESAPQIGPALFEPDHWQRTGRVIGAAPGRGSSLFLDAGGEQWVLRPYRRGGLVARVSESRYLWTGLERTRAFRELRLTAHLHARGLPVPRPVAAGVTRDGPTYTAALITVRIRAARALAEHLEGIEPSLLERVGATVRRFHDAGLDHVDLNARNLLVDDDDKVWLIDLDRCRLRAPGAWREANLERLGRSLAKFGAAGGMAAVRRGYDAEA
ncbi:3-deoxy-D-manno-octulosonic acid kinase [Halomonas sp. MCCC 1A17488]|uniref:3-deoxy-D-manno-octulosonic acid kinase n=1 Tax=Billgrantia sulfidoxydans TaxID=2733484 RepID=A0ABX7VXS6_9GAMM|nr:MULTISPECIES: 3-deoxy-D-manno-octulosonic acid kinase [Halomonas]MCE8017243.1 3-deoxy-D-manno-octulosonic acid kinase [Halomonas sp. MCCC 1A17488]MCG3240576.1 3-deoxy-D-manno-octulosonic acid kinase [Halomonas sp. MCCC 1A17488]QPP49570.1 3-deoxy-D-manno-octulosonic acid kinase [Halomonas sp. SS10-MC5]QTP53206.1 3-deoxy-D-manno-octulosonic acid kinase [Halomonas sulfidoxydans]